MSVIFKKLNLKDQAEILVLNAPESFEPELNSLKYVSIVRDLDSMDEVNFALAFVTKQDKVDTISRAIVHKTEGDVLIWFAYPKGTSKRYTCEFNRDNGWNALESLGFRGIRMVAIDEDWSALRFRRTEFIKSKKTS